MKSFDDIIFGMYSLVLVDDEIEQLHGLAEFFPFEDEGFYLKGIYDDSTEALEMIKELGCDAILTDIRMPEITGLDIAKAVQELPEPPIVLVISAYDDFEYAREAMRYGVHDYLSKPASFDEIKKALRRIKQELDIRANTSYEIEPANLIEKATYIIETSLSTASLKKVADELGINISYLSRLFKEKTGENFQDMLLRIKIERARKLLSGYSNYTNSEIAKTLGYQDTQNFCRAFRKITGVSPQAYRKEIIEKNAKQ